MFLLGRLITLPLHISFLKGPHNYEDISLIWEYSVFSGHVFERKNKNRNNPTNIPKEAVITTQQYNKNLLDMSVSEEIICWLLCDAKVIALEENRNHVMNYNYKTTAARYLYAISLNRYISGLAEC